MANQLEPTEADLEDQDFREWVNATYGAIQPDAEDFPTVLPEEQEESLVEDRYAAQQYRLAKANKMIRLWREWKREQD
jgi:hypothetical protein